MKVLSFISNYNSLNNESHLRLVPLFSLVIIITSQQADNHEQHDIYLGVVKGK